MKLDMEIISTRRKKNKKYKRGTRRLLRDVQRKRMERKNDLAKRRARRAKYSQHKEEEFLSLAARADITHHFEQWYQKWLTRPRPLCRSKCFPQASIPTITFPLECSAFCGNEDTKTLKNLGCGHWMHPECLECILVTVNHDGKDVSPASCPLCKYCLDRMRTDYHYEQIDEELDDMFEADLLAAIQASLAELPEGSAPAPSFDDSPLENADQEPNTSSNLIFSINLIDDQPEPLIEATHAHAARSLNAPQKITWCGKVSRNYHKKVVYYGSRVMTIHVYCSDKIILEYWECFMLVYMMTALYLVSCIEE